MASWCAAGRAARACNVVGPATPKNRNLILALDEVWPGCMEHILALLGQRHTVLLPRSRCSFLHPFLRPKRAGACARFGKAAAAAQHKLQ